jgi:2-polyprenyl-3-methyl-5-hydroxy-6-metoxy-1,4-benzoquinol methylase
MPHCPLCLSTSTAPFHRDAAREFVLCHECQLVFVPPEYLPTQAEEKAEYDLHENHQSDAGYRRFLSRLADPLIKRLRPGDQGLDFGCGPGPSLSVMLREAGFPTEDYDPIYRPDAQVWHRRYDFVTASEVLEHLHDPRKDLHRIWSVLRPGGTLGIMTKRWISAERFASWHYKTDPTHVIFFCEATFRWLARQWQAECEFFGPDVVLLRKTHEPETTTNLTPCPAPPAV